MNNFLVSINSILSKLYSSIENEGFILLDKIGNIDASIFNILPLSIVFSDKTKEFVILALISIIFVFVIFYSLKIILSIYKDNQVINFYYFIIKIIITAIIAVNSFDICKEFIIINSNISISIDSMFSEYLNEKIEYASLFENVDNIEDFFIVQDKLNIRGIGETIICSFVIGMSVLLSIRYVTIILCIFLSPLCIIFSLMDKTRTMFLFWLKLFISNLLIQNINKILIFISIVSKEEKEIAGVITIGTIILMYKLNKKVGEVVLWKE